MGYYLIIYDFIDSLIVIGFYMKKFNFIKEFINYIPKCLLCEKDMTIYISGFVESKSLYIEIIFSEEMVVSKNKNYQLIINPNNNLIIVDNQLILKMSRIIHLDKSCKTCNFKIQSHSLFDPKREHGHFPPMILSKENINYTRKRGKNIDITKYYSMYNDEADSKTYILIDNKEIKYFNLDLSKFKNLRHLNSRISTLITFQ